MHAMADGLTVMNDRDLAHIPSRIVGDIAAAGVDLRYLVSQPAVAGVIVIVCQAEGGPVERDSRVVAGFPVRPGLGVLPGVGGRGVLKVGDVRSCERGC